VNVVTEGELASEVARYRARSVLVRCVVLVVGACVLVASCGSTPDVQPGSAAGAEPPTTLVLESSALEPGGASTWSGEAAGVPWEISTWLDDERTGSRCVRLSFAESHESCEIQPVLHSDEYESVMALHFQRGRDSRKSVIAGLVPVGTDAIGLVGAREHFDLYVDPPTGVFVIVGPADGYADTFTLSAGAEQVECSFDDGDVSDLAYLC
jgi:hypothetical protein